MRVIAIALWIVIALSVAMIVFGKDTEVDTKKEKSEVLKQEYTVTQQRYDKAGIFHITAKVEVKDDKQVLIKQVATEQKGKQKGEVESIFVHIFNAEDINQGLLKLRIPIPTKVKHELDWTRRNG